MLQPSHLICLTCAQKSSGTKQDNPHQTRETAASWEHSVTVQKQPQQQQKQSTVVSIYIGTGQSKFEWCLASLADGKS